MKLNKLELHRSRGLDTGYTLDGLSAGFNVLVGSNGSGKSSLCRAIAGLLWETGDFSGSVQGHWTVGDAIRVVKRESGAPPAWDGAGSAAAPALPEGRFRGCFSFSVDDFLKDDKTTEEIQRVIQTELLAGFDLSQVLVDRKRTNAAAASVAKQKNALAGALSDAERLRGEHRNLLQQELLLREKKESLKLAREAEARSGLHRDAVELAEKRAELRRAEDDLAKFPAGMQRLRGDEHRLLQAKREESKQAESALEQALARVRTAELEWQATQLEAPVPKEHLKVLVGRENQLRQRQSEEQQAAEREAVAVSALNSVSSRLPGDFQLSDRTITATGLEELERLLEEDVQLKVRHEELQSRTNAPQPARNAPGPQVPIAAAIELLASWLAGARSQRLPRAVPISLMVFGGLFLSLGFMNRFEVFGTYLAGVSMVAMGVFALLHGSHDGRREGKLEYLELRIDPPRAWETQAVLQRLNELHDAWALQKFAREEAQAAQRYAQDLARVADRQESLARDLEQHCDKCGVAPDVARLGLLEVARHLRRHAEALGEFEAARTLKNEARAALARELAEANRVLEFYGIEPARDAEEVRAGAEALAAREQKRASIASGAAEREAQVESAQAERASRAQALEEFLPTLGIDAQGEHDLLRQLDSLEGWNTAQRSREQLQAEVDNLARRLKQQPELLALDPAQARAAQLENTSLFADSGQMQEELAQIEVALKAARAGHALADAMAEEDRCREALLETRDAMLAAAAGDFLLKGVGQDHQKLAQPDILRHGGQFFAEFTHHRFELLSAAYDEGGLPFEIRESTGQLKLVEELSSGTRAQLGLALRLAVARSVEHGEVLPIVLDEALTNSDPERFGFMVRSLHELVKSGRQIFFFTADPQDASRLEFILAELGAEAPRHYDLDALRGEARQSRNLEVESLPIVPVPREGEAPHAYAERLGVARIDAFASVDALHLYYLCSDELEALYTILCERVATVGEARSLLQADAQLWRPERRARFEARRTIAAAWLDHYQVGRVPPLLPEVLRECLEGKGKFSECLVQINEELAGDAMGFMEAIQAKPKDRDIRLKGLHKSTCDKLRAELGERGLLTSDPVLSVPERLQRCLSAAQPAFAAGSATREEVVQLVHAFEQWVPGGRADGDADSGD